MLGRGPERVAAGATASPAAATGALRPRRPHRQHDDAAVVDIDGVPHERRIALVYYLTGEPTWDASLGGLFIDHASGRRLAPVHNTLVAFRVRAVWKSTSELGYPEKYCVDLREPPRHRTDAVTGDVGRQRRVHGLKTPRHRADAATETTSRPWRGASEI